MLIDRTADALCSSCSASTDAWRTVEWFAHTRRTAVYDFATKNVLCLACRDNDSAAQHEPLAALATEGPRRQQDRRVGDRRRATEATEPSPSRECFGPAVGQLIPEDFPIENLANDEERLPVARRRGSRQQR